uniref:G-protein coupled receptors family 1 profile domain-containing protein n=1 Tax=Romanomermis culicivorax TaxID=13658 RepID=A0A915IS85_ROMCU
MGKDTKVSTKGQLTPRLRPRASLWKISDEGDLGPNLKSSLLYIRLYAHWSYFLLMFFVPFCVLLFFNVATSLTLKKAQKNRSLLSRQQIKEQKTTYMMIGVVILFFICNFLALIVNSLDIIILEFCVRDNSGDQIPTFCDKQKPLYFYFLADLSNLLIEMNSSANIFIYLSFSTAFRSHLKRLFRAKMNSVPGSNNGTTIFNGTTVVAAGAQGLTKACYKVSYSKIASDLE